MALKLRLTDDQMEALRKRAAEEGRSIEDVAQAAINRYITDEGSQFPVVVESIVERDRELLRRLAR